MVVVVLVYRIIVEFGGNVVKQAHERAPINGNTYFAKITIRLTNF